MPRRKENSLICYFKNGGKQTKQNWKIKKFFLKIVNKGNIIFQQYFDEFAKLNSNLPMFCKVLLEN